MSPVTIREGKALSLKEVGKTPAAPARPRHVVALAASAGGLAALSSVLSALPGDFAAPLLVVLHVDPRHRSWLAEILGRHVDLAVGQVRGGERLEAGRIYVAPPDHHLLVGEDGLLGLSDVARVQHVRPSADLLFASLAESWGSGAIAVVLSGTGRDGADGVLAVKRHGGQVIVQDEASAEFNGMPDAAIRTGAADRVLPLNEIAPVLVAMTQGGDR
jgi:two-component system, chemotaxis family, protein-glutamate methylesterase/glutaminase